MNYLYPNYAKWQSRFILMGTQMVCKNKLRKNDLFLLIKTKHLKLIT